MRARFVAKLFVPILYQDPAFDAFDDFSDFVESISCEPSESCQVRGSNPCRGANVQPGVPGLQLSSSGSAVKCPMTRRATCFDFAGQFRCYNVAYENDVCPRFAHQHVEVSTRGSRGRSNRDRETWRTSCGVAP